MSRTDINKWISGETDFFFDPRQMPPSVSTGSNPREERSRARPSFWKLTHPAIVTVLGTLGFVTVVGVVISIRYSVEPFAAADATSRHSAVARAAMSVSPVDDPIRALPQRTTTLSDARIAAFLKEVSIWYDRRTDPASGGVSPVDDPMPALPQRMTMFSDAHIAAFLKEVSIWYDRRTDPASRGYRLSSTPQEASTQRSVHTRAHRGKTLR